jgi:tetratricopeptide (TPR) repeat protein
MGTVFRALDRLWGRVVTVKRLRVSPSRDSEYENVTRSEDRIALAQEFRVLAGLHHPNIVSVMDYGFDEARQPFFTMDLQENARTIAEIGVDSPLTVRVELLVQMLRALVYLHRHSIIHRDLKPDNVLVVGGQVKVLDFGLSMYRDLVRKEDHSLSGTLAYLAPEILSGAPPSPGSDLYAAGMVAYELLTGQYPFPLNDAARLHRDILSTALPRQVDHVDASLRPILQRLLAKDPAQRYQDAAEVIIDLGEALRQPFAVETVATRESHLQAAPLVAREEELARLNHLLQRAIDGRGDTWLIGGESGVGKSRLLEEARIQALVDGVVVLRGQAVSHGGGPYHVWREILRGLLLSVPLDDLEASVLKGVVPDIARILGRPVEDPPILDSEAAQARLQSVVERLFAAQRCPLLVIVEDLQWVGSESLRMMSSLARLARECPLLVLGSFRNDEAPHLPAALPEAKVLPLRRLLPDEVRRLGVAMIGPGGDRSELVQLLARETEGIPFFVVEVVRALAESTGNLLEIPAADLPQRVAAGGIRRVLQRRLMRVPAAARPLLESAAILGKELDLRLLQVLHSEASSSSWLEECAAAAVLELQDQRWTFAHDKLREQLLADLPEPAARDLHRRAAECIEKVYPDDPAHVAALAHHWQGAGDARKEAYYAEKAGALALSSAAYQEAVEYFERAKLLIESEATPRRLEKPPRHFVNPLAGVDPESTTFRLGVLDGGVTEAYYRLGDLTHCQEYAQKALARFGLEVPLGRIGMIRGLAVETLRRVAQSLHPSRSIDVRRASEVTRPAADVQLKLTETFVYSLRVGPSLWSTLRSVNLCEPAGASAQLAHAYVVAGVVASGVGLPRLADSWCQRALETAELVGTPRDRAFTIIRVAAVHISSCRWEKAKTEIERADRLAAGVGDLRSREEAGAQAGLVALYHGPLASGLPAVRHAREVTGRSRSRQGECWTLMGEADLLLRLGDTEAALARYREALEKVDEKAMRTEGVWAFGGLALTQYQRGDRAAAYAAALRALAIVQRTKPAAFWLYQGLAAAAEVLLSLWEEGWREAGLSTQQLSGQARLACRSLRQYAFRFRLGRPGSHFWQGRYAWLSRRPRRALRHWQRAARLAELQGMPYELGLSCLELSRHEQDPPTARRLALQALEVFAAYGCPLAVRQAQAVLDKVQSLPAAPLA